MIQGCFQRLIQKLLMSPLVISFEVVREHIQEDDGYIRVKCLLQRSQLLEFAQYVRVTAGRVRIATYSYHWQDARGALLRRWDNVPHHPEIASFPHHVHLSETEVFDSGPMTLEKILRAIEGLHAGSIG